MQSRLEPRPVTVLYVEDEEDDAFFLRWAFEHAAPDLDLKIVGDGRPAIDYLAGRNHYANRAEHPLPSLVLLDLNLPVLTGFELLGWMRQQPEFQHLPVVVFSSSSHPEDQERAHALGANGYVQKPPCGTQFLEVVQELKRRWLPVGRRPGAAPMPPGGQPPGGSSCPSSSSAAVV